MKNQKNLLVSILVILLVFVCIYLLIKDTHKDSTVVSNDSEIQTDYYAGPFSCTAGGYNQTGEGILDTYTVKSGDSLLSISKNIYGDSSRISDLVFLNKHTYNSLSTDSPFIEIGWTLLLPEKDIRIDSRGMTVSSGQVIKLDTDQIIIKTSDYSASYHFYSDHTSLSLPDIKPGDCIHVYNSGSHIYKIEMQ